MLDLWLLCFRASYSTLAQFMMNYGNEWDMDLILSYVGTQIWGTARNHVLLLTSRKSCSVTSRGKLVHGGNTGWDVSGTRLRAPRIKAARSGCFGLSPCAILRPLGGTASLRLSRGCGTGVIQRLTSIAAKKKREKEKEKQRAPKQYNK